MTLARRSLLACFGFTAIAALAATHLPASAQTKKELVIGATAGPYADQVKWGIKLTEALALYQQVLAAADAK